ncbi:DNA repair protein RadA [Oenococcus kitaharae]|uniref:DNA repair protein RadA n=1 Tax=Oenococcus kitaharae DSM 17330 TaxID=1045004 RepID=G9WHZ7_9LACO|nr:DNA repair protein RadA [Oenococcus kitaharae]EHN58882.1 RadA-like DNA repair protein [Oenococcus kitaharae DSM 17330]MCV3296864.1 DNA repair protein RadA [Oenococcus kitaharae]OEY81793.1 DNA repair protein RadA [Oenococcus kitaharae]OEY84024.1 DNA repair protein RadA [Oenococcus kitaharae]OEY85620.1 DNA repair protein RadA [Oenococcus kitaharae]
MAKQKTQFVCSNCGYTSAGYLGRCPNCGQWNTLVEEKIVPDTVVNRKARISLDGRVAKPQRISEISGNETPRVQTGMQELNRVLGGGIVPGSLVLIGGDPGIGKSTLMLQVSGQLTETGGSVLYVSGEESANQIKLRADRLGVGSDDFVVYPETDMQQIESVIQQMEPDFLVIDSVQTMQEPDLQSPIGSVAQVREVTADLMQIAKTNGITIFIVGHVTKDGAIAGPKILEHMVDTVLYFEGDANYKYRILRTVKNRFGSTNELGIFEMRDRGLREVSNPSEIFLEERLAGATGSSITASMEGTRPILVEVQALVAPTVFGNAQRVTTGVDRNRVAQILAVLEKHANLLLQNQDAHVRITGGVKIDEPAADLAIALAVASSYHEKATSPSDVFLGEVGLGGEVRSISLIEDRLKETAKLGFKRAIISKNNLPGTILPEGLQVIGVATLEEALKIGLGLQRYTRQDNLN